jgi:hypothetical protein
VRLTKEQEHAVFGPFEGPSGGITPQMMLRSMQARWEEEERAREVRELLAEEEAEKTARRQEEPKSTMERLSKLASDMNII